MGRWSRPVAEAILAWLGPSPGLTCDAAVAGLVLYFVRDPHPAAREMARAAARGNRAR